MNRGLLRRLRALEGRRSEASPLAVAHAQRILRETGEWPSDPRIRRILEDLRQAQMGIDMMMCTRTLDDLFDHLGFEPTESERAWAIAHWREHHADRCEGRVRV